jgi:hypothetical protein
VSAALAVGSAPPRPPAGDGDDDDIIELFRHRAVAILAPSRNAYSAAVGRYIATASRAEVGSLLVQCIERDEAAR